MERDFPHNQLYFNTRATPPTTIANRHHPEALIIEKTGPLFKKTAPDLPALRFSAVDPDDLSAAIQLAKRDIRRQKWEEEMKDTLKSTSKKPKAKGKVNNRGPPARNVSNKDVVKLNKKQTSTKHFLFVKNGASSHHVSGKRSQAEQILDQSAVSLPPPASQTDPIAKSLSEITRLQGVVRTNLQTMRQMEENARGELDTKPEKLVFVEDIEEEKKRAARAEGQATRLTHMVYMLGQQVLKIKEQTDKGALNIPRNRRIDLLNRVAAAHRSVVKIQQTFLQNMPYFDLHKEGMPKSYYDLATIIQHLIFSCDALQCDGDAEVTSALLNLVSDILGFEKNGTKQKTAQKTSQQRVNSHVSNQNMLKSPISKEKVAVNRNFAGTNASEKAILIGSPDRQAVLKAGMDAILRAQKSSPTPVTPPKKKSSSAAGTPKKRSPVPPLALPTTPRTPRASRHDAHHEKRESKSVLIPQAFHQKKVSRPAAFTGAMNYAEPTFSSRLKEVPGGRARSLPTSPRRSASAPASPHPRRSHSHFPHSPSSHHHPHHGASPRSYRSNHEGSPRSYRSNASRPTVRIDEGHNQYRSPASTLDTSLNNLLRNTQKAINANLISDHLMDEVVEDVAKHLKLAADDADVYSEAASLQSSSTMENILQRLGEMEGEQDSIRRRWGTIGYEDETHLPSRTAYMQTSREEGVLSPVPIIVSNVPGTAETGERQDRIQIARPQPPDATVRPGDADPWIFTKPRAESLMRIQYLRNTVSNSRAEDPAGKPKSLYLSRGAVRKIHAGRDEFHQHLKRLSHDPIGKFDPLSIMNRIAEDMYSEVVGEVCRELEEINTDIASHVFSGEFEQVPRGTGLGQS